MGAGESREQRGEMGWRRTESAPLTRGTRGFDSPTQNDREIPPSGPAAPTTPPGECNRCGLCCMGITDGIPWQCAFLARAIPFELGAPESTMCSAYGKRWNGMPITLLHAITAEPVGTGKCAAGDSPLERETEQAIPACARWYPKTP